MLATMERLPFNAFPISVPPSHSPPLSSPQAAAAAAAYASSYRSLQTSHYSPRNPTTVRAGTSSSMPPAVQSPPPYQSEIMAEPATGPVYTNSSTLLPSDHEPAHPSGAAMSSATGVPHSNYSNSPATSSTPSQSPSAGELPQLCLFVYTSMNIVAKFDGIICSCDNPLRNY